MIDRLLYFTVRIPEYRILEHRHAGTPIWVRCRSKRSSATRSFPLARLVDAMEIEPDEQEELQDALRKANEKIAAAETIDEIAKAIDASFKKVTELVLAWMLRSALPSRLIELPDADEMIGTRGIHAISLHTAVLPGMSSRLPSSSATIESRKALQPSSSRLVSSTERQSTAAVHRCA